MTTILIVRHGEDTDNAKGILNGHRDTELTEKGSEQSKEVAQQLTDRSISFIYSSPLKRCQETAKIISAKINNLPVFTERKLTERNFGIFTGKPEADIYKYANKTFSTDRITYFLEGIDVEEFPDLLRRAKGVMDKILTLHKDSTILIVTHGDMAKMLQAAYYGWTWKEALSAPYIPNTGIIELSSKNVE